MQGKGSHQRREASRDMKTSELEVIGAIDGGFKLIAHMLQENVDRDQILSIVRNCASAMNDLTRLCTKRKRLTGKMAQVVAEQRRMLKSSQEREKGFEITQDQVERLQITVRDLQLKNAALEKEVKQLNENVDMQQRTAIVVESKESHQELVSLGIQTDCTDKDEEKDVVVVEEEEKKKEASMLKLALSEKQEYLEKKLSKIETENQNLRGEMNILVEDVEYHRNELSKQASIMKRLNAIINSQKKMIRALKGGGHVAVVRKENLSLSPRPPLSPAPRISSRDQDWNRRRRVRPIEVEDEDEEEEDDNIRSRGKNIGFLSRSFPPDSHSSLSQDEEDDEEGET